MPGPGTELKSIFGYLGFPACQRCAKTAQLMDAAGVKTVEIQFEFWRKKIEHNAKLLGNRGGLLLTFGVGQLLRIAIDRAKGNRTTVQSVTLAAAKAVCKVSQ